MSKILDPNGFKNAVDFVMRPIEGNPIWDFLERIEPHLNDKSDAAHFLYHQDGLELIGNNANGLLETVYFFVKGEPSVEPGYGDYSPYDAELPYPLRADMTGYDVIMQLGKPDKIGEARTIELLGYQRPWIKYYPRENVQLQIEFEGQQIWRVGIGKAFY
jgi:hypothetical protein